MFYSDIKNENKYIISGEIYLRNAFSRNYVIVSLDGSLKIIMRNIIDVVKVVKIIKLFSIHYSTAVLFSF